MCGTETVDAAETTVWPTERAREWADRTGWLVGCNYLPATAINQLEMWQSESFDPERIDLELGWAESLGFNSIRVFLHDIPFRTDREGFLDRIDRFLEIADRHGIGVMLVFFDSVWDPFPQAGAQRPPRPGVHNSGWVQSPGHEILGDESRHESLAPYVKEVVERFKDDRRVQAWDIINEPNNRNDAAYGSVELRDKVAAALSLTEKAFRWAREAGPSQPLTAGVWLSTWADVEKLNATERFCLAESDVVSFHHYGRLETFTQCVRNLRRYDRPLLCTEYMARPQGSTFDPLLGFMKAERVAAYNWGFVDGKSQTIYPWDSWKKPYDKEPAVWFHDIFRHDGSPYRPAEVDFIRKITARPSHR
jgi:hypothetical protein